jgi:hypothetical protein
MGYSSSILSTISKVTTAALILGEIYIVKQQIEAQNATYLEKNREKLLQIPNGLKTIQNLEKKAKNSMLSAGLIVGWSQLKRFGLKTAYKPISQLYSLIGTAVVVAYTVPRAFQELNKTSKLNLKEHSWEIARNTAVHGLNASYSLFTVANLFYGLYRPSLPPVFPPNQKSAPIQTPQMPPAIVIPSPLNKDTKCKLFKEINSLKALPPQQRDELIDGFIKSYPWEKTTKISSQISTMFHPDKNPNCEVFAKEAFILVKNSMIGSPIDDPDPSNHYTHHRELHRIAEIPAPRSYEEALDFPCKVYDGVCSLLTQDIENTKKKIQTILDRVTTKFITSTEAQKAIYSHLTKLQSNILNRVSHRTHDINQHALEQFSKGRYSFIDSFTAALAGSEFKGRVDGARDYLLDTFTWQKATQDLDCTSHGLDCSSLPPQTNAPKDDETVNNNTVDDDTSFIDNLVNEELEEAEVDEGIEDADNEQQTSAP